MIRKVFVLAALLTFALFIILNTPKPIRIEGDGVFYYSWLHSAVFDHDIDFRNQYERFAEYDFYSRKFIEENKITPAGKMPNAYAFGTAIMWLPFFAAAHIVSFFLQNFNHELFRADGYSFLYVLFVNFSGAVYGLLAVFINYRTLRLIFRDHHEKLKTLTAVFAIWLATPWIYYQFFEPFMSHMASLFLVSLFVCILISAWNNEAETNQKNIHQNFRVNYVANYIRKNLLLIIIVFLMISTRWQNAIFIFSCIPFLLANKRVSAFDAIKAFAQKIFPIILPIIAWIVVQSLAWHYLYGKYLLVPQGYRFIQFKFDGFYTLFSSDRGLLLWTPIVVIAILGVFYLFKKSKGLALAVMLAFAGQWAINSSLNDIGGGDAFGARRFIELFPFLSVSLIALFINFKKRFWLISFISLLFILWNFVLLVNYRKETLPKSGEFNIFKIRYFDVLR